MSASLSPSSPGIALTRGAVRPGLPRRRAAEPDADRPDPGGARVRAGPAGDVRPAVRVRVRRQHRQHPPRSASTGTSMYLMPGIIIQNAIFGATTTAIGIAEDLKAGFVDRFRSLPMARSAMLAGRATSDLIKNFILLLVVIGIGYLVGFSFEEGFLNALAMIVLVDGRELHVLVGDGLDRAVGQEAGGGAGGRVHGHLPARVHELGPRAGRGDGTAGCRRSRGTTRSRTGRTSPGYFAFGQYSTSGGTAEQLILWLRPLDHRDPRGLHAALDPPVLRS